jgi:hypothetical protein
MNKTYIPAVLVLVVLLTLHKFAIAGHWYIRYAGFDILMHILGGVGLALSTYWILVTFFSKYFKAGYPMFWTLMGFTFLLGVAWEGMEGLYDIASAPVGTSKYYFDSFKDLVNDMLGAIIAAYFIERK